MKPSERKAFAKLIGDVMALYRRDVSDFALGVWWTACQPFEIEQVSRALSAHAMDPEACKFPPLPGDLVAQLQGTRTDRSLVAWSKVLDAMQRVGAYTSVVFDDGSIHAAIEDVGGWITACRTELDELPHLERRFCKAYATYTKLPGHPYPKVLPGVHQLDNATAGRPTAAPTLIGDPHAAALVLQLGSVQPKTRITDGSTVPAVAALTMRNAA